MQTKKCCRCPMIKPITEFHKSQKGLYGAHSICKKCKKLYMREYCVSGKLKVSKDKYKKTEKGKATIKAYRKSEYNKKIQSDYAKSPNGRAVCNAKLAAYRAAKKQQTFGITYKSELRLIYKNKPVGYTIDHIIPIEGVEVRGLHVPWNLQYLTKTDNSKKSNSFDGTYDNTGWRT